MANDVDIPAPGREPAVIDGEVVAAGRGAAVAAPPRGIDLPAADEWNKLKVLAATVANSGLVGRHLRGNTDACLVVILKGRELRLPPMEAVNSIFVIEGTPTLRASTMSALVLRDGHDMWPDDACDPTRAVVHARRRPDGTYGELVTVTYTIEEARTAGLLAKDNWKRHPGDMLVARCTSRTGRRMFADVLMGCVYVPEELGAVEIDGRVEVPAPRRAPALGYAAPPAEPGEGAGDAGADPAATPPREEMEAEFREIARLLGKTPTQLASRWASAHKKNIEDATDAELFAFVGSYREVAAEARANGQDAPVPAVPTSAVDVEPHPFRYNADGDNDLCEVPGCGLAVDADVHADSAPQAEPS